MSQFAVATPGRPVPRPSRLSQPYWDACKRGELLFVQCQDCGHRFFPNEDACIRCLSFNLEWVQSSGRGTVYSYTVIHREPSPGFPLPSVMAIIDLDEGYSVFSDIVDCEPESIDCEMPVEVVFQQLTEDIVLPMFRPVTTG